MYRIELRSDNSNLCQQLVLLAAKSNGGEYKSIHELVSVAEVLQMAAPEYVIEPIGNNILHIDKKEGKETVHILSLTEVEMLVMDDQKED